MAGVVVRRIGTSIEIRHPDVPIFAKGRGDQVLTDKARLFFSLALQSIAGYVSDEAPVGVSGNLAQSFGGELGGSSGGMEVTGATVEDLEGRVFSSLPYAIVMDQGRAPGARMPPPDALIPWVRRVMQVGGSEEEVRAVAFVVARSIGRKGIKGREFMAHGLEKAMPTVEAIFGILGEAIASGLVEPEGGSGGAGGGGGLAGRVLSGPGGGGLL